MPFSALVADAILVTSADAVVALDSDAAPSAPGTPAPR